MIEHGIQLDHDRERRLGFDEAVYSASKSQLQLEAIIADAMRANARRLFTRLRLAQFDALPTEQRNALDYDASSRTATLGEKRMCAGAPRIAIVTAGSSDAPPSNEAVRTLSYYGEACLQVPDSGVAGLWRLLDRLDDIKRMDVVIVAAGMEGALPSVVGGLLPGVIIALPTSVGYGVAKGGRTALASALASCAPGVLTVNIDNGYGAACAALRVVRVHRIL